MNRPHIATPLCVAVLLTVSAPAIAQQPIPLLRGRTVAGRLAAGDTNRYALELPAGRIAFGVVWQHSVDAVVTVFGPDGRRLAAFDDPARGSEPFELRATQAGTYRIEVTGFERDTGRYDITLRTLEPVATRPEARVDQIMRRWASTDGPGGVVAVTRGGRVVFARGYGLANVEDGSPNTPATAYHLASVSKQFTAFAIALLADEGRLGLDDDIRRYLPELPDYGSTITLRHLLNHTSGLRDQWELWAMAGGRLDDVIRQQDLLRLITRQRELNFVPGAEHFYSNTGYTLLAEVVTRVSGRPFPEFLRERVFAPLGMTGTQVYDDHERLVPGRAYSFQAAELGGQRKSVLSYANMGATSLFSTATDLARWLRNWHTGEVGGPRVLAMMQERGVLNRGDTITYALGVVVDTLRGQRRIHHSGGDAGFRTYVAYFPALDAGVVVLGNAAAFNSGRTGTEVAEAFFGDAFAPPAPPTPPAAPPAPAASAPPPQWAPDSAALAAFTGTWYSSELETVYAVVFQDGRLVARHRRHGDIPLAPQQPDQFRGSQWFFRALRFERDSAGSVTALRLTGGRVRNVRFVRLRTD